MSVTRMASRLSEVWVTFLDHTQPRVLGLNWSKENEHLLKKCTCSEVTSLGGNFGKSQNSMKRDFVNENQTFSWVRRTRVHPPICLLWLGF